MSILDTINVKKTCRACLLEFDELNSLFAGIDSADQMSLAILLMACAEIKITTNDGLPNQLCIECTNQVVNAYNFKLKCEQSDKILLDYISKEKLKLTIKETNRIEYPTNDINIKTETDEEITVHNEPLKETETYTLKNEQSESFNNYFSDDEDCVQNDGQDINEDNSESTTINKPDNELRCEICDTSLKSKKTLAIHLKSQHAGNNLKRCNICKKDKKRSAIWNLFTKLGQQKAKCNMCPSILSYKNGSSSNLFKHLKSRHKGYHGYQPRTYRYHGMTVEPEKPKPDIPMDTDVPILIKASGFAKESQLETHLQQHLKLIAFKCLECNEEFESKLRLKLHRTVHQSTNRRTRQYNGENELTSSEIKIEIGETNDATCMPNGDKIIQCKICNIQFEKMIQLKEHINNHVNKITFNNIQFDQSGLISNLHFSSDGLTINNSDIIDFIVSEIKLGNISKFYSISNAAGTELTLSDSETEAETDIEDINFTNRTVYTCQNCQKTFDRRYKILYHQKVFHSEEMTYQCKYCLLKFVNDNLLSHHLRHQCENVNKSFSCPDCNMKFMWHENLNIHQNHQHSATVKKAVKKNMQKEKTFFCMICDKSFFRQEHLDRHISIHQPNDKKFECPTCHKKFNRRDNMKSHMRIHRENREKDEKHLCVYCGRSFSNSSNLIVHMRRHTGEKPYKCDMCDKGFPRSSDLQCHRRTHTGEKPCLCTICGKGFSRSNKLVRHMRIHTGIRPYKCTYCDRAFTQSNDLTLHIRRHTGDKPYVCGICGDRFIQGTALQTHRRLKGHYEEGNQEAPYASISIHNPNRMNFANRVDRIGLPKTPASEPVEIKPVGRGNSRINQSNRGQKESNNTLVLQPEVVINEPECPITEPMKTLPHFISPSVPTGSSSAYINNHVPFISLEEGDLFAISNLSYSQAFH